MEEQFGPEDLRLIKLPIPVPPMLELALGYPGDRPYVTFHECRVSRPGIFVEDALGHWPGVEAEFLLDDFALPVAAPGYLTLQPGEALLDALRRVRLIVNSLTPDEWEEWARARPGAAGPFRGHRSRGAGTGAAGR